MVESVIDFPFHQLRYDIYLTLEVLMYVEHPEALKFLFAVNKEARSYIESKFITIRNGFTNAGLITHQLRCDFNHIQQLENLYFQALKRNRDNRVLTFQLDIKQEDDSWADLMNQVTGWINAQQQHIKLRFKVQTNQYKGIDQLSKFLNSNTIIEFEARVDGEDDDHHNRQQRELSQKLTLNASLIQSLKCLRIDNHKFVDLKLFQSLQILGMGIEICDISKVIPYLASKFTRDHFQKIQINLFLFDNVYGSLNTKIEDQNLDYHLEVVPKHVQINTNTVLSYNIKELLLIQETIGIHKSLISFNNIGVLLWYLDLDELKFLSDNAKKVTLCFYRDEYVEIEEYEPNDQQVTNHLTILEIRSQFDLMAQVLEIYRNLKILEIRDSLLRCYGPSIQLPQLESLKIQNSRSFSLFTGLISLKHIIIDHWDEMIDIDDIFDSSKIINLEASSIEYKEVLRLFTNLRQLSLKTSCQKDELPEMQDLKYLALGFTPNIDLFGSIYEQCQYLSTFLIGDNSLNDEQCIEFTENMIDQIKQNLNLRTSPLTLIFPSVKIKIQAAARIMRMLEQESQVNQKLKVQFPNLNEVKQDIINLIPEINEERHPILHSYLLVRAEKLSK